jgi:hypothetical protein
VVAKIKGEIMDSKNKRRSIHEMIYGNTPIRLRGVGWREIEAGWWGDEEARNALALYGLYGLYGISGICGRCGLNVRCFETL